MIAEIIALVTWSFKNIVLHKEPKSMNLIQFDIYPNSSK